jgi:hypothetical protein
MKNSSDTIGYRTRDLPACSAESKRIKFDKSKSGGLHETYAVATCNNGNRLSICLKTEKTHDKLYRNGRSQDLQMHTDL